MNRVSIREQHRCTCPEPDPVGPYVIGARKCSKCGLVANWRDFEARSPIETPVGVA